MIESTSFSQLTAKTIYAESIECHRQTWKNGATWSKYFSSPRFASGLLFICSSVKVTCILPSGKQLFAQQGDVLYMPRGSRYTISFQNGGYQPDMYTVNFILYDKEHRELQLESEIKLYRGAASQRCSTILSEFSDVFLFSENRLRLQALLLSLLDAMATHLERHSDAYYPIRNGVKLLVEEWNHNERIERYARVCGLKKSSFYAAFQKWSDQSPTAFRNELRITAARSMLINSDLSVAEIALHCGFDDPYYFSRVFKKSQGISPVAFRKEYAKEK